MWGAIYDHLFLNLSYYVVGAEFPINLFLLAIAFGICFACVLITAQKRKIYLVVKQLYRHEAFSEDRACTVGELKIKLGYFTKRLLTHRGQLTAIIGCVGGHTYERLDERERPAKADFDNARFYIVKADRAGRINDEGMPSYLNTALGCVLIVMLFATATLFVPYVLTFLTGVK